MDPMDIDHDTQDPFSPYSPNHIDWTIIQNLIQQTDELIQKLSKATSQNDPKQTTELVKKLSDKVKHLYFNLYESSAGKIKHVRISQQMQYSMERITKNKLTSNFSLLQKELKYVQSLLQNLSSA